MGNEEGLKDFVENYSKVDITEYTDWVKELPETCKKTYIVRYSEVGAFSHGYLYKLFKAQSPEAAREAFYKWAENKAWHLEAVWEDGEDEPGMECNERSCIGAEGL